MSDLPSKISPQGETACTFCGGTAFTWGRPLTYRFRGIHILFPSGGIERGNLNLRICKQCGHIEFFRKLPQFEMRSSEEIVQAKLKNLGPRLLIAGIVIIGLSVLINGALPADFRMLSTVCLMIPSLILGGSLALYGFARMSAED